MYTLNFECAVTIVILIYEMWLVSYGDAEFIESNVLGYGDVTAIRHSFLTL